MKENEFKSELTRCGLKVGEFAEMLGISRSALSRKLNGETEFKLTEIQDSKRILNLSDSRTIEIFFE